LYTKDKVSLATHTLFGLDNRQRTLICLTLYKKSHSVQDIKCCKVSKGVCFPHEGKLDTLEFEPVCSATAF